MTPRRRALEARFLLPGRLDIGRPFKHLERRFEATFSVVISPAPEVPPSDADTGINHDLSHLFRR